VPGAGLAGCAGATAGLFAAGWAGAAGLAAGAGWPGLVAVDGVVGRDVTGGATRTCCVLAAPAAGVVGRMVFNCAGAKGFPPFACSAFCCDANETGAGGGAVLATTGRASAAAGGRGTPVTFPAPNSLRGCGATPAPTAVPTGAFASTAAFTCTTFLEIGCADVNAFCDVAVT
jgi:hypothetical protein